LSKYSGNDAFFDKTHSDFPPEQSRRVSTEFEINGVLNGKQRMSKVSTVLPHAVSTGSELRNTATMGAFTLFALFSANGCSRRYR